MTDVLLLWHMHQPRYVHPATGRPVLPWVRLHAASGYLDMARALERHPEVHATVNFVPSLVEQIEALVNGVKDSLEIAAEKRESDLTPQERRLVVARSFSVRHDRAVVPRPRYAELLALRGTDESPEAVAAAAARFSPADLRDLQCLFLLAWLGWAARDDEPVIDQLDAKGRQYTEEDKRLLLGAVRRACQAVIPSWRRLAQSGRVELASSPYYHPIIPLLVDSEVAKRSRPGDTLPPRFARPEDARMQIRLAQDAHERWFGARPRGMWPPEGSLSPEAVELYGSAGVQWLCGDDETLARSLGGAPGQQPHTARAKARIWRHAEVDLVFRDRELSDRIGFRYADLPAAQAAGDLLGACRSHASSGSGEKGIVGIFLDGENAWESYPRRGRDFLDALYGGLASGKGLRSRTISEALAEHPSSPLPRLHSGSWIDASFRIWIGDPVKNEAWSRLRAARDRLAQAETGKVDPAALERARRMLLAAEGSDWFWWFGEPFSSAEDPLYDDLFRAHLAAAYRALGDEPPSDLADPIYTPGTAPHRGDVTGLLNAKIDGRAERFYEWHGAAVFEVGRGGAMAEAQAAVQRVHIGFDHTLLYLRLDPARGHRRRLTGATMIVKIRAGQKETRIRVLLGAADGGPELVAIGGRVAAQDVVELAVPWAPLGGTPRAELQLGVTLEFAGVGFARVPRDGVFAVTVPWPGWEDENWRA